jgi:hypothetical protein
MKTVEPKLVLLSNPLHFDLKQDYLRFLQKTFHAICIEKTHLCLSISTWTMNYLMYHLIYVVSLSTAVRTLFSLSASPEAGNLQK